jgi:HEAT repeat protein
MPTGYVRQRRGAGTRLHRAGRQVAAPALIAALQDKESGKLRRPAAFALGKVGSLDAEAPLKGRAQGNSVEAVRDAAKKALNDLKKFKKK